MTSVRAALDLAGRGRRGPFAALAVEHVARSSTVDVGVFAHNEAANIRNVLLSLTAQRILPTSLRKVLVFSSSYDGTNEVVDELARRDSRIILVRERTRDGKAASVNRFLKSSDADICVVLGADVVPDIGAVDALVEALNDPGVGLVGATVVPTNRANAFFGYVSHLLWGLHGRFGKVGEMIAFRRCLVPGIADTTSVDEAFVQVIVSRKGKRAVCVPDAVVWNRGPGNVSDFMRQRSRIFAGHMKLAAELGAKVPTMDYGFFKDAVRLAVRESDRVRRRSGIPAWKAAAWLVLAGFLEAAARVEGVLTLVTSGEQTVWKQVPSGRSPFRTGGSCPSRGAQIGTRDPPNYATATPCPIIGVTAADARLSG
ncbi:MAG: glycosyltransferase [Nitrososphaerota archaeon]|nr:glycosyltransferase [Nitrososphaerota archaeon]MDG7026689.1 glycosyltransferase [Nitrososphaerota archaeon]